MMTHIISLWNVKVDRTLFANYNILFQKRIYDEYHTSIVNIMHNSVLSALCRGDLRVTWWLEFSPMLSMGNVGEKKERLNRHRGGQAERVAGPRRVVPPGQPPRAGQVDERH